MNIRSCTPFVAAALLLAGLGFALPAAGGTASCALVAGPAPTTVANPTADAIANGQMTVGRPVTTAGSQAAAARWSVFANNGPPIASTSQLVPAGDGFALQFNVAAADGGASIYQSPAPVALYHFDAPGTLTFSFRVKVLSGAADLHPFFFDEAWGSHQAGSGVLAADGNWYACTHTFDVIIGPGPAGDSSYVSVGTRLNMAFLTVYAVGGDASVLVDDVSFTGSPGTMVFRP